MHCGDKPGELITMQPKRSISIMVFGILSIACGLFVFYTIAFHLVSMPWAELKHEWYKMISWFFVSSLIFFLGIVAGFVVSGIGVVRAKPWSRYLLLITTGIALWSLVNRLIVLGPCTEEFYYISRFSIGALFIGFFNRKSVRTVFPYRKGSKVLTVLWIIVFSIEIAGASILWFTYRRYTIPTLQEGVYPLRDESFYSKDYIRTSFPLKYTVAIPKGFTPFSVDRDDTTGITIMLFYLNKGSISMGDPTFLETMYSSAKEFGYRDPHRYYQKFFSERYGLYFLVMKMSVLGLGIQRIERAQINGLSVFVKKGKARDKLWNNFYLFRGSEVIGHVDIIGPGFTGEQMDDIISSLRIQHKPLESARDLFQEGKTLFQQRDFEGAKFSFVSALCLNWENPQYHYYLGRTFFETENWFSAKRHLKKAISLQPDHPGAEKLLNEVETKEMSGK
jgi:hypothetical protein